METKKKTLLVLQELRNWDVIYNTWTSLISVNRKLYLQSLSEGHICTKLKCLYCGQTISFIQLHFKFPASIPPPHQYT